MPLRIAQRVLGLLVGLLLSGACLAQEIVLTPKKASGVYSIGEKIEWRIAVRGEGSADVTEVHYLLKKGGLAPMGEGTIKLASGSRVLETSLDQPGSVLAEFAAKVGEEKQIKALAGAVAAPDKIQPSAPAPADFDAFWAAKVAQLNAVPPNPVLTPDDSGKPAVEYYKLQMDNIHGSHIYGQLARPKKEGKFPALLIVQWAGVYGLPKWNVVGRAEQGWLALNIMAHDLPFDKPEEFYTQASQTTLKDYMSIGCDDRDKSYFLRMYLSCYRAADYLANRPDWDGKTLVVMGTSQGGQQTLITAGFYPKITAMLANVPAGCDVTGPAVGRAFGFPYWANYAKWRKNDKILQTGRYFDAVNFAAHIKCPALVSLGLIDETCPPAGVLAACNQMQGKKEVLILPQSNHHGSNNAQAAYFARSEQWLKALVRGESPLP